MAGIWYRLRRKLACDARRRGRKKSKPASGEASSGLERLAALLQGVQSKKTSLVERTEASMSAARSLSRSAQEWTASTLLRSDGREGSKSPEVVFLQCAVRPSDAHTRSSEYTEQFSLAEAGFNSRDAVMEDAETEAGDRVPVVPSVDRGLGNLSEGREPQGRDLVALPVRKTGRCMGRIRGLGWKQTSNPAFVVLVALGAFASSRFDSVENSLAAILTFNVVTRIWRRGKLYARVVFSSVAFYLLTPLRSYLTYYPRRLSLGLPRRSKVNADDVSRSLEIEVAHQERGSSLVPPLESAFIEHRAASPLPLLLTIPESSAETPATEAFPAAVSFKASGELGPPRRLAKRVTSRFKKLKMFRSSSLSSSSSLPTGSGSALSSLSHSESGSPVSPSSSPDRHRKCPFSRRLPKAKSDIPTEVAEAHSDSTAPAAEKKLVLKKSRLCRMSSTETLDTGDIAESASDTALRCPEEATDASRNVSWPMVVLLVTLLFLLLGRVPAIMATSVFLIVVSNAHHDRAHPRIRWRETRASEAARKLHRSPPPRRHPGSPSRRS